MNMARAAIAILCVAAAGCNPEARVLRATPTPAATPGLPPLKITGRAAAGHLVSIVQQNGNRKQYALVAKSVVSHSAQNAAQATFHTTTVTFYDKDGTSLTATAPQATIDQKNHLVTLTGGVTAHTSTGATLTCSQLAYDSGSELISGEGNVRMTAVQNGSREVLTGDSFTSDIKLTRLVMK